MDNCIIKFDGACEPVNPGGIAAWGYIVCHNGAVIAQECGIVGSGPGMTNNIAEYTACIEAVKRARGIPDNAVRQIAEGKYEVIGSRGIPYEVDIASETCTCQDFQKHRSDRIPIRCKHIIKIGFFTQRAQVNDDQHARKCENQERG